jgi:hypothetical protein
MMMKLGERFLEVLVVYFKNGYFPICCPKYGGYLAGVVEEIHIRLWVGCLVGSGCLKG